MTAHLYILVCCYVLGCFHPHAYKIYLKVTQTTLNDHHRESCSLVMQRYHVIPRHYTIGSEAVVHLRQR